MAQNASIQTANESAIRIAKLEEERIAAARESAKIASLEEKLLTFQINSATPTLSSVDTSSRGINLTKFKSSDGPSFKGPYRDTEAFLKWFTSLKIFFLVKKINNDSDRIILTGSYLLETNLQAFWAHNVDDFMNGSWTNFKDRLFRTALPSDWNDKLREKILQLRMSTSEDFKHYSTRARSTQSLLNHDNLILNDYTSAEHVTFGMIPELKSSIRIHAPLKADGFDYNQFEERCDLIYEDLVVKKIIQKRAPPSAASRTHLPINTQQPPSEKPSREDFFWKIKAYLDSAGLCHYCKKQCGSEPRQCTGTLSRERIVFPPGFKAPPQTSQLCPAQSLASQYSGSTY